MNNFLKSRGEVIEFIEAFGFELEVCRWEQPNEALNPQPLMRFKWAGEAEVKGGFNFSVYKQDRPKVIIKKLQDALVMIGKKSKEYDLQKYVFEDNKI